MGLLGKALMRLVMVAAIMEAMVLDEVMPDEQNGGLFCISNCPTCPVTCTSLSSPPPPPSPPPPETPVDQYYPPAEYSQYIQPPPPAPMLFPYSPATPTPPFSHLDNPSVPTPPSPPNDYSSPYYMFYSSKAAPILIFSHACTMALVIIFFHGMYFCC